MRTRLKAYFFKGDPVYTFTYEEVDLLKDILQFWLEEATADDIPAGGGPTEDLYMAIRIRERLDGKH